MVLTRTATKDLIKKHANGVFNSWYHQRMGHATKEGFMALYTNAPNGPIVGHDDDALVQECIDELVREDTIRVTR